MAEVANKHVESATQNATEESKGVEGAVEEQSPTVEETFDEPASSEYKFRSEWTLWEHYEALEGSIDYSNSMCKACWFNDLVSFSVAWNTLPHRHLSNIFYNDQSKTCK